MAVPESINSFLEEVTEEILYNIAYEEYEFDNGLKIFELSDKFSGRVSDEYEQYEPMDFFGFGNTSDKGWFNLVRQSPGLLLQHLEVSIDHEVQDIVYRHYNSTILQDTKSPCIFSIAKYREMLLINACKLMVEGEGCVDVNSTDSNGNTPLHFIAALPGTHRDDLNLFKYLLDAGADPTKENENGINILHVIAGRMKAEKDEDGDLIFGEERIDAITWEYGYRQTILNYLSQKLSHRKLFCLTNDVGRDGNTVMHEWAMSTVVIEARLSEANPNLVMKENKLASKLIELGGNINTLNKFGLLPIHFAFHPEVFEFLVANAEGAICHVRSYEDETPLLFILKYFVTIPLIFLVTLPMRIFNFFIPDLVPEHSICNHAFVIAKLNKTIERRDVQKTAWMTDHQGVSAAELVLTCIRVASCHSRDMNTPNSLFELLCQIFGTTTNANNLKHRNIKRQSLLHVLLNWEALESSPAHMIYSESIQLLVKCLVFLLDRGIEVNAVDAKGQTALHLCCLYYQKSPNLFGQCAQLLMNHDALTDLKDNSGTSVQDMLSQNSQLKAVCVQTKRKVHCHSQCHQSRVIQLAASSKVKVVKKYRYSSESPIGSGAFSCVYVAIKDENEDKNSKMINCSACALKRLEKARIDPKEIKREMDLLLSISRRCENIVDYYETIDEESFYYIALELMEGDLQKFVEDDDMKGVVAQDPVGTVQQAAHDIISGLVFLHDNKFLHRDLKPSNILYTVVDRSLRFKIGDFGLAKNISPLCTFTTTKGTGAMAPGTRCWMAPELVSLRSREHTTESDVFALGLVLHYLIALGKHAFVAGTEEQPTHVIEKSIVDMKLAIEESLSSEAKHFIQLILVENHERRPPANVLLQHPFLWSKQKKNKFLVAVGDQVEAVNPSKHPKSALENCLQTTDIGTEVTSNSWDSQIPDMYRDMTNAGSRKVYRVNTIIDLVRFMRNAHHHKEEHSPQFKTKVENNIFLKQFPSLFFDVYLVLFNKGFLKDPSRTNIREVIDNEI